MNEVNIGKDGEVKIDINTFQSQLNKLNTIYSIVVTMPSFLL
jgi:hypothetical protein